MRSLTSWAQWCISLKKLQNNACCLDQIDTLLVRESHTDWRHFLNSDKFLAPGDELSTVSMLIVLTHIFWWSCRVHEDETRNDTHTMEQIMHLVLDLHTCSYLGRAFMVFSWPNVLGNHSCKLSCIIIKSPSGTASVLLRSHSKPAAVSVWEYGNRPYLTLDWRIQSKVP